MQEVTLRVVHRGDSALVRLSSKDTGKHGSKHEGMRSRHVHEGFGPSSPGVPPLWQYNLDALRTLVPLPPPLPQHGRSCSMTGLHGRPLA